MWRSSMKNTACSVTSSRCVQMVTYTCCNAWKGTACSVILSSCISTVTYTCCSTWKRTACSVTSLRSCVSAISTRSSLSYVKADLSINGWQWAWPGICWRGFTTCINAVCNSDDSRWASQLPFTPRVYPPQGPWPDPHTSPTDIYQPNRLVLNTPVFSS